jgi:putative addiction module CopG family antidote
MKLNLPPKLARLVQTKVAAGLYLSPTEVAREAFRLLAERDRERLRRVRRIRKKVAEGLAQLRRGQRIPGDQVFEELRVKSEKRRSQR